MSLHCCRNLLDATELLCSPGIFHHKVSDPSAMLPPDRDLHGCTQGTCSRIGDRIDRPDDFAGKCLLRPWSIKGATIEDITAGDKTYRLTHKYIGWEMLVAKNTCQADRLGET